jgi:fatty-acyl-CoA synthase
VFIGPAQGRQADDEHLRAWCRDHLAHYKVPGRFAFTPIPRTSTGKIQKFALRDQVRVQKHP